MNQSLTVPIQGMTCASCSARLERVLKQVPGVDDASVNLATEAATVSGDVNVEAVRKAVEQAGFKVPETECSLDISGMTCASCSARVEKALAQVPGVLEASINLATEKATVRATQGTGVAALITAVEKAG